MIVRKYTRRTRCPTGRSFSDDPLLSGADDQDSDFRDSQDSSAHDPFSLPFPSSQDSSHWSLDSFDPTPPPPSAALPPRPGKRRRGAKRDAETRGAATATATLMEAQEFGEMMEHVDEVNFALDGLRPGQPARIRRASLLSLLSICGTAQQRRLLRAQGMARRIIDAILGLTFDDSPSTVAAAALFFVLASDLQDDHLLDSPSCIRFLLKLLNPPLETVDNKASGIGSKLLGIRNRHVLGTSDKGIDSGSRAIISKVHEILSSCKEIKSGEGDDEETERPELSSKWISLLTMEKACLSTVSFEDTSDTVRRDEGSFKERLRELGGLDAIFNVIASCHLTMEGWFKNKSPSVTNLKDGVILKSLVLILKCLKIMENAAFLSKDNQDHLLGMKGNLDCEGFPLSFIGVVLRAMKSFSDLSLLRSSSTSSNSRKSNCHSESVTTPGVQMKEIQRDSQNGALSSDNVGRCGTEMDTHMKSSKVCHKRQKLSTSQCKVSVSGSETIAYCSDLHSAEARGSCSAVSFNGASTRTNGKNCVNTNGLKLNMNANGLKVSSGGASKGWISIKAIPQKTNSGGLSVGLHMPEDVKSEFVKDSYDPFAFDEEELKPSKWELTMKKEPSQTHRSDIVHTELSNGCDQQMITIEQEEQELSQLTNEEFHLSSASSGPSVAEEDFKLLEDCLLTAIKVLMNLTNDNPVGCQQIAACGGMDTMASLIIGHFPSFYLYFPLHIQLKEKAAACKRSIDEGTHGSLSHKHLSDNELDFLVAFLGLLVNLVEKDSQNRSLLASARISVEGAGRSESNESPKDVITLLCSMFLANQGAAEAAGEEKLIICDEASLLQGEREAEMMIIEAYVALLLAFLSTESRKVREAIARYLPNHNLEVLVPVLERFVAFHLTLNMISPETHSSVIKVIESCKGP